MNLKKNNVRHFDLWVPPPPNLSITVFWSKVIFTLKCRIRYQSKPIAQIWSILVGIEIEQIIVCFGEKKTVNRINIGHGMAWHGPKSSQWPSTTTILISLIPSPLFFIRHRSVDRNSLVFINNIRVWYRKSGWKTQSRLFNDLIRKEPSALAVFVTGQNSNT